VLWSKNNPPTNRQARFNWHEAAWSLHVPMIKALFDQIATPTQLRDLNIVEVLDWTTDVLNRVDRKAFFDNFEEGHAVQYFYEPFLQAFDPELRKELGVWYTPIEIVKYMVARVDTVLREELKIPDGLADPRVYVLDPCCGTGAYLVEVLHKIHETLKANGGDDLAANDVKVAAMNRVFGFEILPAPFVVSHLQLGLLLQNLGAPLTDSLNERVGVYLTNALTGWEPPSEEVKERLQQLAFSFAELRSEYDAAERVKQEVPILVILGNPPYNAFAGVSPEEERGLVEPYKEGLISEWGIKKFNLDDLYIRFFRLAEGRVAEKTGKGVVSFISNHSWVSDPSFVVLRQHLLHSFDYSWIENMHGNRKISEYAPDGATSETIFAILSFSAGIQQGVAVSLWVKTGEQVAPDQKKVFFRDDLNEARAVNRRAHLLESLNHEDFASHYEEAQPDKTNRYSFRPSDVAAHYQEWPRLPDLCADQPSNGLMEKRAGALIDIDHTALEQRMKKYYDPSESWSALEQLTSGLTRDAARFDAKKARKKVIESEAYEPTNLRRYSLRPFDTRWCYYSAVRPLWNEPRPTLWAQC
jgi:predicted helicase